MSTSLIIIPRTKKYKGSGWRCFLKSNTRIIAANKKLDKTNIHSRFGLKANELAKYGAKNKKIGKLRQCIAQTIESKTPTFSIARKRPLLNLDILIVI